MDKGFVARLPKGTDLLESITSEFKKRSVKKAAFSLIGALDKAVMGFYDPVARVYNYKEFAGPLEIVSCIGNVSEKDGEIFVHAHIVISGEDFLCYGGHLAAGCPIFAAELSAAEIPGSVPKRGFDEPTGLFLWSEW